MDVSDDALRRAMRVTVAEGPPPGVDLEGLIRVEQRRERVLFEALGSAAVGMLLLVVVSAVFFARGLPAQRGEPTQAGPASMTPTTAPAADTPAPEGTPGACPTLMPPLDPALERRWPYQKGEPASKPVTEDCGQATARLDGALMTTLRAVAPSVKFMGQRRDETRWFARLPDQPPGHYYARPSVISSDWFGIFTIRMMPATSAPPGEAEAPSKMGCDAEHIITCEYRTFRDGTVAVGQIQRDALKGTGRQYEVTVFRPDATVVQLGTVIIRQSHSAGPTAGLKAPLSLDQLIAIGRAPGLTLYP